MSIRWVWERQGEGQPKCRQSAKRTYTDSFILALTPARIHSLAHSLSRPQVKSFNSNTLTHTFSFQIHKINIWNVHSVPPSLLSLPTLPSLPYLPLLQLPAVNQAIRQSVTLAKYPTLCDKRRGMCLLHFCPLFYDYISVCFYLCVCVCIYVSVCIYVLMYPTALW